MPQAREVKMREIIAKLIIAIAIALLLLFNSKVFVDAAAPISFIEKEVGLTTTKTSWLYQKPPLLKLEEPAIDEEELRYMSAIIFAEAGNQCEAGQQAVGIVIMERVKYEEYFEDDVVSVIYEPGQFTPVENGMLDKALTMYDEGELPESCIEAAKYALEGNTIVNYNDVDYDLQGYLFFARYVKNKKLVIEDHQFK